MENFIMENMDSVKLFKIIASHDIGLLIEKYL